MNSLCLICCRPPRLVLNELERTIPIIADAESPIKAHLAFLEPFYWAEPDPESFPFQPLSAVIAALSPIAECFQPFKVELSRVAWRRVGEVATLGLEINPSSTLPKISRYCERILLQLDLPVVIAKPQLLLQDQLSAASALEKRRAIDQDHLPISFEVSALDIFRRAADNVNWQPVAHLRFRGKQALPKVEVAV